MNCSLKNFYVLAVAAIALLVVAIIGAVIPYNVGGLCLAITSVASVSFIIIPAMRDELKNYDTCMGSGTKCNVASIIDLLGQLASIISFTAFLVALLCEIPAVEFNASIFLVWLGVVFETAASYFKYLGIVNSVICICLLTGLLANVKAYQDCREKEIANSDGKGNSASSLNGDGSNKNAGNTKKAPDNADQSPQDGYPT